MASKKCIICGKEVSGWNAARVKEDSIIASIRKIKQVLGVAQGNELYVCESDLRNHAEKRKKFERNVVISSTIAILVVLIIIGIPLLAGKFELITFFSSITIGILIIAVEILFEYTPAVGQLEAISGQTVSEIKKTKTKKVR